MFFHLLIAMILGLTSPSNTNSSGHKPCKPATNSGTFDTGGDTGQTPPPKID